MGITVVYRAGDTLQNGEKELVERSFFGSAAMGLGRTICNGVRGWCRDGMMVYEPSGRILAKSEGKKDAGWAGLSYPQAVLQDSPSEDRKTCPDAVKWSIVCSCRRQFIEAQKRAERCIAREASRCRLPSRKSSGVARSVEQKRGLQILKVDMYAHDVCNERTHPKAVEEVAYWPKLPQGPVRQLFRRDGHSEAAIRVRMQRRGTQTVD